MHPRSLFSLAEHLERLSKDGDPLEVLAGTVEFERFRPLLTKGLGYSDGGNGEQLIARLDDLVAARETWENGAHKASNEELCTLLERCTALLLEVQADRSLVLKIGKLLEERGLKDRANTSWTPAKTATLAAR